MAKSSSPRLRWDWPPQYEDGSGINKPGFQEYIDDVKLCNDLVEMFNQVAGLNMTIRWNNNKDSTEAFITENLEINAPKMHPNRRIYVKHEISHPVYGSDFDKIKAFLDLLKTDLDPFYRLDETHHNQLRQDAALIHNIFEDIRVNSWWAQTFPGDGRRLFDWMENEIGPELYRKSLKQFKNGDIPNFALYSSLLILGQPAKSIKWQKYKQEILDCAEEVKLVDFDTCLLRVRTLIYSVIKDLLDESQKKKQSQQGQGQQSQPQGQKNSNQKSTKPGKSGNQNQGGQQSQPQQSQGKGGKSLPNQLKKEMRKDGAQQALTDFLGSNKRPDFNKIKSENSGHSHQKVANDPKPASDKAKQHIVKITSMNKKELSNHTKAQIDKLKKTSQRALQEQVKSDSSINQVVQNASSMVALESKFNVQHITSGESLPNDEDIKDAARKMQQELSSIKTKKKRRTDIAGSRLIMNNVIQNRVANANIDYYEYSVNDVGYELVLILDCSGSMSSSKKDIERLFSTVSKAIEGIKELSFRAFSFQQKHRGNTDICIWDKGDFLFGGELKIGGRTPLPQAIHFVNSVITKTDRKKSVLVLGDGFPVFVNEKGESVDTDNLVHWTRREVDNLAQLGISTYGLMVGSSLPDDESMTRMFVSPARWVKLDRDRLLEATLDYIRKEFMKEMK